MHISLATLSSYSYIVSEALQAYFRKRLISHTEKHATQSLFPNSIHSFMAIA